MGGRMSDVSQGRRSPIAGYAVLVSDILPDVLLLADIGDSLGAVQRNINAVQFTGTWAVPEVAWLPLSKVRSTARTLLPTDQ
jgi:hypothetical protein